MQPTGILGKFSPRTYTLQFAQKICPNRDRDVGPSSSWISRDRWLHSGYTFSRLCLGCV